MDKVITPLTPAEEAQQKKQVTEEPYLERVAVAIDDLANVVTDGLPDETISSRMARWDTEDTGIRHEVGEVVSEGLDLLQPDHGVKAEAGDEQRAETVIAAEEKTDDLPK